MFDVTIDLSEHFTNYKKKCVVIIRNEWSTIRDLQIYVKQIFALKKIAFTTTDHVWIPATEPIDILKSQRFDELIGVGIKPKILQTKTEDVDNNNGNTKLDAKKSVANIIEKTNTEFINEASDNIINVLKACRKRKILNKSCEKSADDNSNNLELSTTDSSTPINPSLKKKRKRHKKAQIPNETLYDKQENLTEKTIVPAKELSENHLRFDEFGDIVIETAERKVSFKNVLDTLNPTRARIISTVVQNNQPQDEQTSGNNINGLNQNNENHQNIEIDNNNDENADKNDGYDYKLKNTEKHNNENHHNNKNDENSDKNDAYDYKLENTDNKNENCANNKENDDNKENNNDDYNIKNNDEKISKNNVIIKENQIIKNGFEILKEAIWQPQPENIIPPIKIDKKPDDEVKIIIDSDSDIDDDVQFIKTTSNFEEDLNNIFTLENEIKKKRIFSISQLLKDQPKIKDTLIFKIFRLNDKSEPSLSDYICGKLENIMKIDNENYLEICIIAGAAELKHPQGKFSLGLDDDKTDYLKIQFNELYETRILNHNIKDYV